MSEEKARCAAVNCKNTASVTHRFPKDYKRCRIWAERAGCLSLLEKSVDVLHASYRLCSDHFHDTSYSNKKKLSIDALPEVFPEQSECLEAENVHTSLEYGSGADFKLGDMSGVASNLLCRTCACPSDELIPVFGDKGVGLQLLEKIHTHLPIMVTPEDLLPVAVCTSCTWKLEMCHRLVLTCLEADVKLRALVSLESNSEGTYSDEYDVESDSHAVHDSPSGIKDEPVCNEGTYTLDDSANILQFDSVDCVQHADEIQSSIQMFGMINYKQETMEGVIDHQCYNKYVQNALDTHVPDSSGDVQPYDQASDQTHTVDERECAADQRLQDESSVHVKDVKSSTHFHEKNVDCDDAALPVPAILNHTNVEEGSVVVTKCRMVKENPKFKVLVIKVEPDTNIEEDSQTDETVKIVTTVEALPAVTSHKRTCKQQQQHTDGHVDESSLEARTELLATMKKFTNVKDVSTGVLNKTQTVGCSSNNALDKVPYNSSRKSTNDLACVRSDQTMSSRRIRFSEDNFTSQRRTAVCNETFHCSECSIVYASQQLLENHKINHSSKSGCTLISGNKLLDVRSTSLQPVVVLERLKIFSENDKLKVVENMQMIDACPLFSTETRIDSTLVLPLSETTQTGLSSSDTSILNRNKEQNKTEVIKTFDGSVTPGQRTLNQGGAQNNSESPTKVCKESETTHRNDTAKIIENINSIIKRNEEILLGTTTTKVEKLVMPSKKLKEEAVKQKPKSIMPQVKFQGKVHKVWKCLQCFNVFNTERALRGHMRLTHPVIHKCQFCDKEFESRWRFKQHMSIHTQEKQYICEFCGKHFRLKYYLHNHLLLHNTEGKKFKCQKCEKKFATKERYTIHCSSHDKASYLCDICGKSMKYFNSLRVHRQRCVDPSLTQQHCCTICGKVYRNKRGFTDHLRLHTNERPFVCTQCGDCFRTKCQLSYHMLHHINARQHKCPVCGKGFNHRQHMRVHVLLHQRSYKYICDVCECAFMYMREFNAHRRNHSEEEIEKSSRSKRDSEISMKLTRYICQICGKHLSNSFTLKNHVMTHTEEKPFSCETCGKSFSLTSNLKVHQRIHTNDKPFTCDICGKRFAFKIRLQSHQFEHTGEKPYQCNYCSKRYSLKQNLIIHERMHTGERPFKCAVCSKGFCSQTSLKAHTLVHSDQRPFQCTLCHKSFKRRDVLHTHQRIHAGERPFSCNICGRGFKQNGDCKKHEQTHFKSNSIQDTLSLGSCNLITKESSVTE